MMQSIRLEKQTKKTKKIENNIIKKDVRNLFRLKKEINRIAIKDKRYLSRLTKEDEAWSNKDRDIKNLFEYEEEDYYKPLRVGNWWNSKYVEYQSNGDRNKILSVQQYLHEIRPSKKHHKEFQKVWQVQNSISKSK